VDYILVTEFVVK